RYLEPPSPVPPPSSILLPSTLLSQYAVPLRHLHSFPTRRSSDLQVIYMKGEGQGAVAEVALQYYDNSYNELLLSFANNVHTPEGGTHEEGFKLALTRVLNEYGRAKGILKEKDENLSGPDAREGIIAVISVKLQEAQFEGQTKAKLGNTFIKGLVSGVVYQALTEYFEENPAAAKAILEKATQAAR